MKIDSLKSLRMEIERLDYKLKVDREKLVSDIKLLRYRILEDILRGITGVFKRDTKKRKG
jgi:hypothetical protein